jgi:hypothetical protein
MTRMRYTTPARSQGVRRRVFVRDPAPEVECTVRKRLVQRLDGFHCDLQAMRTPHVTGPAPAGTHIALNDAPPLPSTAPGDGAESEPVRVRAAVPLGRLGRCDCGRGRGMTVVAFFDVAGPHDRTRRDMRAAAYAKRAEDDRREER